MVNIFEQDSKLQQIMETQRRQDEEIERNRCAAGAALDMAAKANDTAEQANYQATDNDNRLRRAGIR